LSLKKPHSVLLVAQLEQPDIATRALIGACSGTSATFHIAFTGPNMRFRIYRYNPEKDREPYLQDFELRKVHGGMMLRDALLEIKKQDETLSFRHSCGEGVCGSDGLNINGRNGLACVTPVAALKEPVIVRPFPGMPVIRDLVVDMSGFYRQYREVRPYLVRNDPEPEVENLQSPEERDKLDGLYECILCGCCSTACPSFWWNPDRFLGPAALLQAWRFLADSRDQATEERLEALEGPYRLFRCHTIMNCVEVCPKQLNPTRAIGQIKALMVDKSI
jgi:succinate dehydrogenase / fumarate reductase iron-sulfur subunit